MIIFFNLLLLLNTVESSHNGECSEYSSTGEEHWFCCNNHEYVNGICIEFLDGFESFDGSPCRSCQKGFFGKECIRTCDCTIDICDHVTGCLNVLPSTEAATTGDHAEDKRYHRDTENRTTLSTQELTAYKRNKSGTSFSALKPTTATKSKTGIDDSKLPIPSIIVISTVLILLVFVSLSCVCWKYKVPCKKIKQMTDRSNTETSSMHAEDNKVYFINQKG